MSRTNTDTVGLSSSYINLCATAVSASSASATGLLPVSNLLAKHQRRLVVAVANNDAVHIFIEPPLKEEVILCRIVALDMRSKLAWPQLISILLDASGRDVEPGCQVTDVGNGGGHSHKAH